MNILLQNRSLNILKRPYIKENMNNNKVRFSLWVQQQNQTAINMYQKKGFRYVNKSTISMLKLKK
jgi:ribosomal protein S18 acetylase RimI-like enzyme